MTIDGGATGGYCATGSCVIATPPSTRMNSAITHAKIGRSMKKLGHAIGCSVQLPKPALAAPARRATAAPLRAAPDAAGAGWRPRWQPAPGHRLDRRAGHLIFWKPSTITCSPAFRPVESPPTGRSAPAPILTGRGAGLLSAPTTSTVSPCVAARHRLLRHQDAVGQLAPARAAPARTCPAAAGRRGWAPRRAASPGPRSASTVRSENSSLPGCGIFAAVFQHHAHRGRRRRRRASQLARWRARGAGAARRLADCVKLT